MIINKFTSKMFCFYLNIALYLICYNFPLNTDKKNQILIVILRTIIIFLIIFQEKNSKSEADTTINTISV